MLPLVNPALVAQRTANIAKGKAQLEQLKKAVEHAPMFLCSTHGSYDRTTDPVEWVVPPNTFIFEAQTIGDLTLTDIDVPLWELLQGGRRWGFIKYLMKEYRDIEKIELPVGEVYKQTLANLILYKPGDKIYERVLSIGGGRNSGTNGSRGKYGGMGFFRFDAKAQAFPYRGYGRRFANGSPNPYEILPVLQTQMVQDGDLELTDRSFVESVNLINQTPLWRNGTPVQGVDFRTASPAGLDENSFRIFIFSSCAAVSMEKSREGSRRWIDVARLQQERINEAMTDLGIYSLLGGGYGSIVANENIQAGSQGPWSGSSTQLRPKKRAPSTFFVPIPVKGAIDFFSQEDADLDSTFLMLTEEEQQEEEEKIARAAARKKEGYSGKGGRRTRRIRRNSKRSKRSKKTRRTP